MCDILKIKKKDAQMGELGSGKLERERERMDRKAVAIERHDNVK